MSQPSMRQTIEVVAGFGFSLSAVLWLLTLRPPQAMLPRFGFTSALWCAGIALAYCWAVFFAFVMRKRGWPARTFKLAGLLFIVPGFLLAWNPHFWPIGLAFCSWGSIASYVARKLAYPKLTPEQIYAQGPRLTLFPN
jgi:hypothetical protein